MSEPTVTDAVGNPIFAAGGFPVNDLPFVYAMTYKHWSGDPSITGIFLSLEDAMKSEPGSWRRDGNHTRWNMDKEDDEYRIERMPLEPLTSNPITLFALSILQGDPVACDAVRDILKL